MKPISSFDRVAIGVVTLFVVAASPAAACRVMDYCCGPVMLQESDLGRGTASQVGNIVTASPGEICFIAMDLRTGLAIDEIRFKGPAGNEFEEFTEDPAIAERFGPGYRAWSAAALAEVELAEFTLEIDYTAPNPNVELPRIGDEFVNTSIAMGQTDGAGQVVDHANITKITAVDLFFAE